MRVPKDQLDNNIGRLTREKVNKIAHGVTDALAGMNQIEFLQEHNAVRLEVKRLMEELLKAEAELDQKARQKIESQRRTILEGTPEWDILYRKYYNEEVKKLGI
jgi:hypothetical protein